MTRNYLELIDLVVMASFRSYAELERKAGVTHGSIRRVVNGEKRLTEFIADRLASVTDLNPVELLKLQVEFYYAEFVKSQRNNPQPGKHLQFYGVRAGARQNKKRG